MPLTLSFFKSADFTLLFLMSSDLTELCPGRATATPPIATNSAIAEITRAGDGRNRLSFLIRTPLSMARDRSPQPLGSGAILSDLSAQRQASHGFGQRSQL